MAVFFAKQIQRLADEAIVLWPLLTAWAIITHAVRALHDAEDLFAEPGGGKRLEFVFDFETKRGQELRERRARFRKFDKTLQLNSAIAGRLGRDGERKQPAVVA